MRLLVCGGRNYEREADAFMALDFSHRLRQVELVIHGAAPGADTLAKKWALARGISALEFPADWFKYGPKAGPFRNQQMIDEGRPDGAVAFIGGAGTADMIRRCLKAGIPVWQPYGWRD